MMNEKYIICLYSPESTGKSTLAKRLAEHYQTESVPEVARELITSNDFTLQDIERIAQAYHQRFFEKLELANKILICDTDLITTQIYSQHYLQAVPPIVAELQKEIHYDHYFLLDIDVPWVADGLRDLGNQRQEMFQVFKHELENRNIAYTLISGDYATREKQAKDLIDKILMGD